MNPVRQWDLGVIDNIIIACIIMQNVILEDKMGLHLEPFGDWGGSSVSIPISFTFRDLQAGSREVENIETHFALQIDLIDHLWKLRKERRRLGIEK